MIFSEIVKNCEQIFVNEFKKYYDITVTKKQILKLQFHSLRWRIIMSNVNTVPAAVAMLRVLEA